MTIYMRDGKLITPPRQSTWWALVCAILGKHRPGALFWRITGCVSSPERLCERCGYRAY